MMSLSKKDPSLRVAANDPHLVSLGGDRLSTAVTIHYIPIGDTTIGFLPSCSISLNGSGVRPAHCTIFRSEHNEVTIVPEPDARTLIDNTRIFQETNLPQGAMITIGNSNYLRFNNPAEAEMMRSAMGSNERISMPQIDFPQPIAQQDNTDGSRMFNENRQSMSLQRLYETKLLYHEQEQIMSKSVCMTPTKVYDNVPLDLNGLQCPKVFTADLPTVNMPAKDVLGQKYASFAKNLAENHRHEKANNMKPKASLQNGGGSIVNIPSSSNYIQNPSCASPGFAACGSASGNTDYLAKVDNISSAMRSSSLGNQTHAINATAYDRYPKPGSYGCLQIFPMNGINTEINNAPTSQLHHSQQRKYDTSSKSSANSSQTASPADADCLEDMLRKCSDYADRQNQSSGSITSSPIVQNRIKTNGSLPREKKSPFYYDASNTGQQLQGETSHSPSSSKSPAINSYITSSTGYENVRLNSQNCVEINGQTIKTLSTSSPKTGYENIVVGKYVPQSPRTKIRTNCLSPKKEHSFSSGGPFAQQTLKTGSATQAPKPTEYEQLIRSFEEKLQQEMKAIEESSHYRPSVSTSTQNTPAKRPSKNVHNLTLNLQQSHSLQNSPRPSKKPAPAPRSFSNLQSNIVQLTSTDRVRNVTVSTNSVVKRQATIKTLRNSYPSLEELKRTRQELVANIQALKRDITEQQKQENEALRELDMEKALVCAELNSLRDSVEQLRIELKSLQQKIHTMEARRNATRVMEENQQAKLKQSIEMKVDQLKKLKAMLKEKPNNACLKEELHNVTESLENDRKTFEDLEFQYLEEESEWHAYREELHAEEKGLIIKIEQKQLEFQHLEHQECSSTATANADARTLKHNLLTLISEFSACQERLQSTEMHMCNITGELHINSSDEDDQNVSYEPKHSFDRSHEHTSTLTAGVMAQSLFGSAELLCPKWRPCEDVMSKSVNENMFYNNKIEQPQQNPGTSTSRQPQMQLVHMDITHQEIAKIKSNDDSHISASNENSFLHMSQKPDEKCTTNHAHVDTNERIKFNLSLGSDDFEVNPLEKRVPSQDDIDRISRVALDAPIAAKGATTRIFDSIKEIERNRQLLLAQQGHHVIEHERQKMTELKKKSHDAARAQYLSMANNAVKTDNSPTGDCSRNVSKAEFVRDIRTNRNSGGDLQLLNKENQAPASAEARNTVTSYTGQLQHRHSQPEFATVPPVPLSHIQSRTSPRPLSDTNSELSCDELLAAHAHNNTGKNCKSSIDLLSTGSTSGIGGSTGSGSGAYPSEVTYQRTSSVHSNDDTSAGSELMDGMAGGSGTTHSQKDRKRALPKHQRPLTRYLPIFSPDLNLRHHIETAGHQITLCPHVFVDEYSCRGYLHKLGATFHGWARRWFVLDRQRNAFIYYADKAERKPRGGAYFSTIDEVYLDHLNASKSGRPHCTLIVKTKKRSYHLQAASDAAARIWIDAIITGAQGNIDY